MRRACARKWADEHGVCMKRDTRHERSCPSLFCVVFRGTRGPTHKTAEPFLVFLVAFHFEIAYFVQKPQLPAVFRFRPDLPSREQLTFESTPLHHPKERENARTLFIKSATLSISGGSFSENPFPTPLFHSKSLGRNSCLFSRCCPHAWSNLGAGERARYNSTSTNTARQSRSTSEKKSSRQVQWSARRSTGRSPCNKINVYIWMPALGPKIAHWM